MPHIFGIEEDIVGCYTPHRRPNIMHLFIYCQEQPQCLCGFVPDNNMHTQGCCKWN